jgi:hypothetical protein
MQLAQANINARLRGKSFKRLQSAQSPKNSNNPIEMEFSSNEDTDDKDKLKLRNYCKTDDQSQFDSFESIDYSKIGEPPEDSCHTVLICFTVIGFVAWFPCYQILVALPYYTQTDKYEWSLIAFPLCLFLPSIFSDAFMLMQWPKVRVSF